MLRIVGDEVRGRGCCDRTVDEIAARAGACRTVVKDAIRTAATLGLLTVQERRRQGQKNLPNVVRIVSREWTQWLARGPKSGRPMVPKPIGVGNFTPTDSRQRKEGAPSAQRAVRKRVRRLLTQTQAGSIRNAQPHTTVYPFAAVAGSMSCTGRVGPVCAYPDETKPICPPCLCSRLLRACQGSSR